MALSFLGKSECSICGKVIKPADVYVGFPHFLDESSVHYKYSDSVMHKNCFENWKHKEAFVSLLDDSYSKPVDLDDPFLKEMIIKYGVPSWLKTKTENEEVK